MGSELKFTVEEIRNRLLDHYGNIPKRDLNAYNWLSRESELNNPELSYEERFRRHQNICIILEISPEGGLAGRDVREF